MLSYRNVSAAYGAFQVLQNISFDVTDGECVAIFGHNGAGKTTLLKCAVGALEGMEGEVSCAGRRIEPGAVYRNTRLGIGFVPQGHNVFKNLGVERNLRIAGLLHDERYIERVYELFPALAERRAQLAGSLSGGQQQMLAIGRAMMARPRLLLLDEPSMGLAPLMVHKIFETIKAVAAEGVTLLLVEQNAKLALEICDRGYVMESGTIALRDTAKALLGNPEVRRAYLGE